MKRFVLLGAIGILMAGFVWAAAGPPEAVTEWAYEDTITVDSQYTEGFEELASVIVLLTDTCNIIIEVSGVAHLDPGNVLWIGCGNDSLNRVSATNLDPHNNYDSLYINWPSTMRGPIRLPFVFYFRDSTESQSDVTDTFFVSGAVGGSGSGESVMIENFMVAVQVGDDN